VNLARTTGAAAGGKRARTTPLARLALVGVGLALFALLEGLLALLGAGGARDRSDPLLGFTQEYSVFVPDRERPASGLLVTDPAKRESFNAQSFAARKAPGAVRVFCLGGSAVYGFPRGAESAFPAFLGEKLARAFPDRRFELVNAGGLSYAAFRCVNVMRELARYEPDAFVYYGGSNEYVERRFFATILAEPAWRRSLRARVSRLRTYTLLAKALVKPPNRAGASPEGGPSPAGGLFGVRVERDDDEPLPRSDDEDRMIEANFRASLEQMAEIARDAKALFVLGVPTENQRDWPPDLSIHDPSLGAAALAAFDARLAEGRSLREAGDQRGAARALEAAVALDPRHAEAHFLLAGCYHAIGERDKARAEFDAAIATDGSPIRATPRLLSAIRDVAAAERALLIDAPPLFAARSADGLVGNELLVDYCHPTPEGHELIADALFAALAGPLAGAPGAQPPSLDLARETAERSPFRIAWEGQMLVRQERFGEAAIKFHEALAIDPQFAYALEGLGRCLMASRDTAAALTFYEGAARANATNPTILTNLGNAYLSAGRYAEAAGVLERAIAAEPRSSNARTLLARSLIPLGRRDEARRALEDAIAANPNRAEGHRLLGRLLEESGDVAGAESRYREALRLEPRDAATGYARALLLTKLSRSDEALAEFQALVDRDSTFYPALGAIGLIRMQRGERERAAEMFRRVLAIHPGDALAARYLGGLGYPVPPAPRAPIDSLRTDAADR